MLTSLSISLTEDLTVSLPRRQTGSSSLPHCNVIVYMCLDEAMTFLVTKILNLSSTGQSQPQEYISLKDRDDEHTQESEGEEDSPPPPEGQERKCCNI